MHTNPRQKRSLKQKIIVYILLLGALAISCFLYDKLVLLRRVPYISPLGGSTVDINSVEKDLKDQNIPFSSVTVSSDFYLVSLQNNGQVMLSPDKDIKKEIASLQRILIQLTIEGKTFKSIDFRFAEPTISF